VRSKSGSCRREEEAFQEEENELEEDYKFCLVGSCLTDSVMHFPSLRNTMADLWHPIGGISITYLGEKPVLFQFFYEVDMNRVFEGTPWSFNNHLLLMHKIQPREDLSMLPLIYAEFWVQIHDLPLGLMSEAMRKKKIVLGTSRTIYARFQYEKLSLFCFLCGKLGHGENFCLVRVRVDSTKIIIGWDISLRA
ncbi:hypothetical protein Goshw_017556, partial [Gossypium schwendimanii]|nr:hypothetical protein [Gossypium schwendimanii]